MITLNNKHIDFENPTCDMILIDDIARGLSRESRFNGHTGVFLSVAQHSCFCSENIHPDLAFEALMHDATEAYMKDIPSPLKILLPEYKIIEARLDQVIRTAFQLPLQKSRKVHVVDSYAFEYERLTYMRPGVGAWSMDSAYIRFLERFHELRGM